MRCNRSLVALILALGLVSSAAAAGKKPPAKKVREQDLAEALRENLRRRKTQAEARDAKSDAREKPRT